jgi:hypothetical protein
VVRERLYAEIGFVRPMSGHPQLRRDVEADLQQFARFLGAHGGDAIVTRHGNSAW